MTTVVVRLVTLMGLEDGKLIKVRPNISLISNRSSSIIVMLSTLLILPAGNVMFCGTKRKSLPSTYVNEKDFVL